MIQLDSKGFNLFTALVSFLLIALSVLLINGMIQSERSASTRISQEQRMAELQAVADISRSDAIQVFNYSLRKTIEDWMTDKNTGGITLDFMQDREWDDIKRKFAEAKFGGTEGGRQFAEFTSASLQAIFFGEGSFGSYSISIEGEETFEEMLYELTKKSVEDDDFFEVIDCPTGNPKNCDKGTFYVNLKVAKLSQEEYEKLPRIRVINKSTGDEIKEIILPRANFRIYVPLRVFKAIAEARAIAHFPLNGGVIPPGASDIGLFSPNIHNQIEEMAIGMCDEGYCNPRGNPFTKPGSVSFAGANCPGNKTKDQDVIVNLSVPWLPGLTYNASDPDSGADNSMKKILKKVVKKRVCDIAEASVAGGWLDSDPNDSFVLVGGSECAYIRELDITAFSLRSKNLPQVGDNSTPTGTPGGGTGYSFNDCPRTPERKIGIFGDMEKPGIETNQLACSGGGSDFGQSHCTEIEKVAVKLWFKETDRTYMVDKTDPDDKIYSIRLLDNYFTPFTPRWDQGGIGGDCKYGSGPTETPCSFDNGWTCVTHFDQDFKNALGCAPQ